MFAASKTSRRAAAAAVADPFFDNVTTLLESTGTNGAQNNTFIDSSTNNFTITRNGNTTQGAFSPFGENWSNYFDGTGDYLTTSLNSAQFGTSDFTIEFWINLNSLAAAAGIIDFRASSSATFGQIYVATDRTVHFYLPTDIATTNTLTLNQWNHVAITRSSGTLRMFINGVLGNTTSAPASYNASGQVTIGAGVGGTSLMTGYLSNVRFLIGTALYTANFTPSTVPLQPIQNTSLLTCRDSNIVDDSANNFTITRNGDVSVQKFGPFAGTTLPTPYFGGYFDGSGDDLSAPSSAAFTYGTGDFCIEGWFYFTGGVGGSGYSYIFAQGATTGTASLGVYIQSGVYKVWNGSEVITSATGFVQGSWVHLALTRSGTAMRLFVNGVQSGSATNSSNITTGSTIGISIGRWVEINDSNYITGYVSNFRVVKGTALYTANFTPPTAPLTAISGTSLLTCQSNTFIDNSTNNFAITVVGNTRPTTFAPFAVTYSSLQAYTPSVFGGSMYFDGTGDFLTVPSNAAFALPGDFTFETWMYPTSFGGEFNGTLFNIGTFQTGLFVRVGSSNINIIIVNVSIINASRTTFMPTPNCWYHLAVVRRGSTVTLYINGVSAATATNSTSIPANGVTIAISAHNATETYMGYLSGMRLLKNTALYTSNFVPQNAPPTPITNTSLLLNGTNAGIYDASTINTFETVGNAQVNTSIKRYGLSSIAFDGNGDCLDVRPLVPNFFGQRGAYTIEMWIYPTNLSVAQYFYSQVTANFLQLAISGTGRVEVDRSGVGVAITSSSSLTINTWQYVTLVSDGTNLRLYINGVQSGSTVSVGTQVDPSSQAIRIGAYQNNNGAPTFSFYGNIQDFRITRGIARYTTTFTPPAASLPDF